MMKWMFLQLVLIFSTAAFAADDSTRAGRVEPASISVKKDPRLDVLTSRHAAYNKKTALTPRMVKQKGFRLQVIGTQDRGEAMTLKATLLSRFADEKAYLMYQAPHFRIRFGNFKTREEALGFRDTHLSDIQNIYVVADTIEFMWYPPKED
jgi:hypothetical protein